MILCSVWVAVVNAGTAETEVTTDSSFVFSQVEYQNVTAYTGDIILDGTDVMLIKDAKLELNGGLLMRGDSTLILDNAELYPAFGRWQESYELHDNAKIVMKRGSSIGSGIFNFRLYDNSLLDVTNSKVEKSVEGMDTGIRIQSFGSYFRVLSMLIGGVLEMHNSSAQVVGCDGDSQIVNSTIDELTVDQNARIVDSQIKSLTVRGGNGQAPHPLSCYLINSTYGNLNKDAFDKGTLYVGWHLNVTVEDAGQIVKGAKVEVYYVTNGSLAQQKVTSSDGKAQFDLVEWKLTELGNQYVGDYRIKASYGTTETQTITLTSSQELVISESSTTWIILPVILVAALVIIVCVKRLPKNSTHAY
jgi:hypothetical protein